MVRAGGLRRIGAGATLACAVCVSACGSGAEDTPRIVCSSHADCKDREICSPFSDECLPSCLEASRPCLPPLSCTPSLDPTDPRSTCTDIRSQPSCFGTPTGQAVPFVSVSNDPTDVIIHFDVGEGSGCVPVTYEPSIAMHAEALDDAVAAWNAVECSQLCLSEPIMTEARPDILRGETAIHVLEMYSPDSKALRSPAVTTSIFSVRTGRELGAIIELIPDANLSTGDLVTVVGFAIGLSSPTLFVDSALSPASSSPEPTAADREALCVLYGDPPYCE